MESCWKPAEGVSSEASSLRDHASPKFRRPTDNRGEARRAKSRPSRIHFCAFSHLPARYLRAHSCQRIVIRKLTSGARQFLLVRKNCFDVLEVRQVSEDPRPPQVFEELQVTNVTAYRLDLCFFDLYFWHYRGKCSALPAFVLTPEGKVNGLRIDHPE